MGLLKVIIQHRELIGWIGSLGTISLPAIYALYRRYGRASLIPLAACLPIIVATAWLSGFETVKRAFCFVESCQQSPISGDSYASINSFKDDVDLDGDFGDDHNKEFVRFLEGNVGRIAYIDLGMMVNSSKNFRAKCSISDDAFLNVYQGKIGGTDIPLPEDRPPEFGYLCSSNVNFKLSKPEAEPFYRCGLGEWCGGVMGFFSISKAHFAGDNYIYNLSEIDAPFATRLKFQNAPKTPSSDNTKSVNTPGHIN